MPWWQVEKKHRNVLSYPFPRVSIPTQPRDAQISQTILLPHHFPLLPPPKSGVSGAAAPHPKAQGAERGMNRPHSEAPNPVIQKWNVPESNDQGHKTECPASLISSFTFLFYSAWPLTYFTGQQLTDPLPQSPVFLCPSPLNFVFFFHTSPFSLSVSPPFLLWHLYTTTFHTAENRQPPAPAPTLTPGRWRKKSPKERQEEFLPQMHSMLLWP